MPILAINDFIAMVKRRCLNITHSAYATPEELATYLLIWAPYLRKFIIFDADVSDKDMEAILESTSDCQILFPETYRRLQRTLLRLQYAEFQLRFFPEVCHSEDLR
jgi:hypothetical protein